MATYRSQAITVRRKTSSLEKSKKKYIWMMQPSQVMTLFWVWKFHSIFGMVVEVKQMSTKDKLERKKYMGVWRWESEVTARMMNRFPNTVIRYMERKSPNMRCCNSDFSENPIRRNLLFPVRFLGAV